MPSMNDVLGVILGGGRGTRLYPLVRDRAKPAVPIGGKYRLIDIPISNCINSDINRMAILTQFNSVSLHRHIARTYTFDAFNRGWVQILAAEQTPQSDAWYQGTADAVRKQLLEIRSAGADYTLILAGDHLYRMDFKALAEFHWEKEADITVAVQPVLREDAPRFGLLKRGTDCRITDFVEKPREEHIQDHFVSRDDLEKPFLGSMGIYLFKTEVLVHLLTSTVDDDFGGEVIPSAIKDYRVFGYDFDDFWEDIGTIRSFYETNLLLTRQKSPFNFHDPERPIYTRPRFLPGSIVDDSILDNVLLADGCRIQRAEVQNTVIGLRSQVARGTSIKDSIMMGADYYDPNPGGPENMPLGLGDGCQISGAILDKNVRVGSGVVIQPFPRGIEIEHENWVVRDGIVVIPKNTVLLPGTVISP
ncbi:MAG: glucose-1-phosphate adenylyltransferase [Anaerolineales bacterium]